MASGWEAQQLELLLGICSWSICSIGMMVFNKLALQVFPLACTLVLLQFGLTLVILLMVARSHIRIGSGKDVIRWCLVIPFFTGKILSTMLALENTPITMVMTFRTITPMISLLIERFLLSGPQISPQDMLSCGGAVLGMYLYTYDLEESNYTKVGLCWVMLNNIFTVGDRLLQRYLLTSENPVDISLSGIAFLNNLLSMPPVLLAALATRELSRLPEAWLTLDSLAAVWILASCVISAGISYTTAWVTTLISATSFLVVINVSKFVIIFLEVFVLRETGFHTMQILGTTISISAGIAYGLARLQTQTQAEAKMPAESEGLKGSAHPS